MGVERTRTSVFISVRKHAETDATAASRPGTGRGGVVTVLVPLWPSDSSGTSCGSRSPALANEGTRTRYVWAAVGVCVLLLFGAIYSPGVGHVLEVQPPSAAAWGLIALMRLVPLAVGQVGLVGRG